MSKPHRFVTYRLCDNDFSQHMLRAAEWLVEFFGKEALATYDDDKFRLAMASHMAGESLARAHFDGHLRDGDSLQQRFEYLAKARILRGKEAADEDCDCGAVSIDTSTGYIWIH
jgi:hypothetical protein